MEKMKKELIKKISLLYQKYGIKSMTMDDVANELGISKKTLYQYFADKAELVKEIVSDTISEQACMFSELSDKRLNAIEVLYNISMYVSKFLNEMNPSISFDLRKYYPEAWEILGNHKKNHIYNSIKVNMQKGINEGLYRPELKVELIAAIYVLRTEHVLNFEPYEDDKEYTSSEIFEELIEYHIRGIATPKGIKCFEEILKNKKNK
jgi:TetR/AcrR family transcriptional regulator, cholesterol catabolism regulator